MKRLLSSLLALTMLLVCVSAAYADAESTDPVLARVGEDTITLSQAQEIYDEIIAYYHDNDNGYDFENEDFLAGIRENAMAQLLEERFIFQTAKANGLDQITEEDEAQLVEDNNLMWENAIADYISYFSSDSEPSEDDLATMRLNAVAYFGAQGYTVESTLETSRNRLIYNRLMDKLTEGFTVSDEDVDLTYQAAAQQEMEANGDSVLMYEYMIYYLGQNLHYRPEGYRGVLHILLRPDEAALSNYTALAAKLEEQNEQADADETDTAETDEADETAAPEEPVTAEQVEEARLAVIASVQDKLDEITAALADGTPFIDLVDKYGTDTGMSEPENREDGYPVHTDSVVYDPAFTKGAMSIEEIGGVSEPVVGSYGVHVIYYLKDLPSGVLPLDEETRDEIYSSILSGEQDARYQEAFFQWLKDTEITFTEEGASWYPADILDTDAESEESSAEVPVEVQ